MTIRRYSFGDVIKEVNDDLALITDHYWARPYLSLFKGELYDPDEFDLVPKRKHVERRLKEKEQQLKDTEGILDHYKQQLKKIQGEIDELKEKLLPDKQDQKQV